jgi:hypothetical protein
MNHFIYINVVIINTLRGLMTGLKASVVLSGPELGVSGLKLALTGLRLTITRRPEDVFTGRRKTTDWKT